MTSKMLRQIVAVLLGAVVGWGLIASWQRQKHQADQQDQIVIPALAPATTDTIRYIGPLDTVILARQDQRWTVNGFPAGQPVVEAFFRATTDTSTRSELIAESESSYQRLGVDSLQARRLTVIGGGRVLLDLRFGGRGPDFEGFYVRQADDPRVFLLRGNFANLSVQPLDDWRDRVIVTVPRDSIGHVEVMRGKGKYQVTRGSSTWSVMNGVADSTALARFLGAFAALRSTGFPRSDQADSARFAPAERSVTVYGPAGRTLAAIEFDSLSWGWMARPATGGLYKLDQRTVDLITPMADSLLRR